MFLRGKLEETPEMIEVAELVIGYEQCEERRHRFMAHGNDYEPDGFAVCLCGQRRWRLYKAVESADTGVSRCYHAVPLTEPCNACEHFLDSRERRKAFIVDRPPEWCRWSYLREL